MFDIQASPNEDSLVLPDGSQHYSDNCPAGAFLTAGQTLAWHSSGSVQGNNGNGLPMDRNYGHGGGWQICFA